MVVFGLCFFDFIVGQTVGVRGRKVLTNHSYSRWTSRFLLRFSVVAS